MGRAIAFMYGAACYIFFLVTFCYAIGFVGNVLVPKSIDSGMTGSLATAWLVNALLLGAFAIQHTIMARQGFKKGWTKIISPVVERSTFVLLTCLLLSLMFWQWRPMGGIVWNVENATGQLALNILSGAGWLIVLVSTFLIDHFDLFGLKQVIRHLQKKEFIPPRFHEPGFYRYIRHPLYLGFMIAFWATPTMTLGHLLFAVGTTGYMFVGITFEERDMVRMFGNIYLNYRRRVPMIFPSLKPGKSRGGKMQPESPKLSEGKSGA